MTEGANIRRRQVRQAAVFFAAAALGLSAVVAAQAGGGVEAAAPGEPSYLAIDVALGQVAEADDGGRAASVSYAMTWSGDEFPGYALCRAEVLDTSGSSMGAQEFEFFSLMPTASQRTLEVRIAEGSPASANVYCGRAELPSESAGYEISQAIVGGTEEDPRMMLQVRWKTDEPPLYQACSATFRLVDGLTASFEFGLGVGPGEAEVLLTPRFYGATVLDVSCGPVTKRDT